MLKKAGLARGRCNPYIFPMLSELNDRASEVLKQVVVYYLESGEPMGSRTLSRHLGNRVSAATIRNVMADLQDMGLIYAPHTSAGRLPTDLGLRFYVDTLMGESPLSEQEQAALEEECRKGGKPLHEVMDSASKVLSGLSSCAALVIVPKAEKAIRHIDFLYLEKGLALAVLVMEDGTVENRLMDVPAEITPGDLQRAGNFLKEKMYGKTIAQMREDIERNIEAHKQELDALTARVIKAGLAFMPEGGDMLVVHGAGNILKNGAERDLESIQRLFDLLEKQETATRLLQETSRGQGVQIFIGSENRVFQSNSLSLVISPSYNGAGRIIGATGVIGPTRLNYRKVIPMVDYVSRLMSRMMVE